MRTGEPESMSPYLGFSAVQQVLTSAMSKPEKNGEKHVVDIKGRVSAAPVTQDSASGSSDATVVVAPGSGGAAAGGCTLVAKWQGSTIELPALPRTTTIGEVKARSSLALQ